MPVCGFVAPVYLPIFGFVSKLYLPVYGVASQWYTPLVVSPAPTPLFTTGLFSNCSNPRLYPVSACKDNNKIPISIFCMFLPSSKNIPTIFHFAHFQPKTPLLLSSVPVIMPLFLLIYPTPMHIHFSLLRINSIPNPRPPSLPLTCHPLQLSIR